MAIKQIKCPQCGGIIEANTEKQFAVCQNCGKRLKRKQTPEELNTDFDIVESSKKEMRKDKYLPITVAIIFIGTIAVLAMLYLIITAENKKVEATQTTNNAQSIVNAIIDEQEKQKDDFKIEYKSSTVIKDNGKSYLLVNLVFTNNSEKATSFSASTSCEAYQNGIQLTGMILFMNERYDASLSTKNIQPGKSLEVQEVFELRDTSSVVSLNVNPILSASDFHYLSVEIKLK